MHAGKNATQHDLKKKPDLTTITNNFHHYVGVTLAY
jgi:hypothetical protein